MRTASAVLVTLALSGSLVACGDDGDDAATPTSATSSLRPSASPSVSPEAPSSSAPSTAPSAAASPDVIPAATPAATPAAIAVPTSSPGGSGGGAGAPVPFPADKALDTAPSSGGPLSVVAVRVAHQPGFDRVVFELAGKPGEPGWRVEYVEDPSSQGSGEPVEVRGTAVLAVTISGTGYPMDTGVEEFSGEPVLPPGLRAVQDVELGAVFEGDYEAFVGVSEQAPFRVFRLADPARVVVDVGTD